MTAAATASDVMTLWQGRNGGTIIIVIIIGIIIGISIIVSEGDIADILLCQSVVVW